MKKTLTIFIITFLFSSCTEEIKRRPRGDISLHPDVTFNVQFNKEIKYQTIVGFGASDCWMGNYVGNYWPEEEKEQAAKWLFSTKINSNVPEGIGLSSWRFNLGGGTAEQGDESNIDDPSRRSECFLQNDGSLDWTHAKGQQYLLTKAYEYGCRDFTLFGLTPPVQYTKNGKGYSTSSYQVNLRDDCIDLYAKYYADVIEHFKSKGIEFTQISPVNEPQNIWNKPSQEGTSWENVQIADFCKRLGKELQQRGLPGEMVVAEARYWYELYRSGTPSSDVLADLFDSSSPNYIGNIPKVRKAVSGHSYITDANWNYSKDIRETVRDEAGQYGVDLYQTEWSMLGSAYNDDNFPGFDNATYMDLALYMSQVIHHDLEYAGVTYWSYWTAFDMERYSQKNRFYLIHSIPEGGDYGDVTEGGTVEDSPNLWVLGNYSLFIRPGYKKIEMNIDKGNTKFFGTAYVSDEEDRIVAVFTNMLNKKVGLNVTFADCEPEDGANMFVTSLTSNLRGTNTGLQSCVLPPRSVTTIIYNLK